MASNDEEDCDIDTARRLFIDYSKRVADLTQQQKPLKKEQKKYEKMIIRYMEDNGIESYDVGDFQFVRRESTRFKMSKEDLIELLEDPADADQFDVTTSSFGKKKRKIRET